MRVQELTRNLSPGKGKGLILLRLCNELIRRLSRPTREHTVFVGRVLSLLSSVFPLGERSGVNFRGDFNVDNKTTWDEVAVEEEDYSPAAESESENDEDTAIIQRNIESGDTERELAEGEKSEKSSDEELLKSIHDPAFYTLFWQVQAWFGNPTLLFASQPDKTIALPKGVPDPVPGGNSSMMRTFRISTRHILDVFDAVGRKEKELEGKADTTKQEGESQTRHTHDVAEWPEAGDQVNEPSRKKRKIDSTNESADDDEEKKDIDSFFPKYLTGRNLFEYELRDATFRRHVLAQYLVLFQYLRSFTQSQKDKRAEWKNKAMINLQPISAQAFVLDEADEHWIQDTWRMVVGLLNLIPPQGKVFADSMLQVLRREARWIKWKTDNCPPIDRPPLSDEQLGAFAKARKAISVRMRNYPHTVGTAALSRLWEDGVRKPEPAMRTIEDEEGMEIQVQTDGLDDLEFAPIVPSLKSYASQIAQVEAQQEQRRKELEWAAPCVYAISAIMPDDHRQQEVARIAREAKDDKLSELEQMRVLHAWRGARLARCSHLGSFARIKMDDGKTVGMRIDDITRLMKAVEEREKRREAVVVSSSQVLTLLPTSSLPASVSGISVPASPTSTIDPSKEADVVMNDVIAAPAQGEAVKVDATSPIQEGAAETLAEAEASVEQLPAVEKEEQGNADTAMQS